VRTRSALTRLSDAAQYAVLRGAFALTHSFGIDQNMRTATAVGRAYARVVHRHRLRAQHHIAQAMPELAPADAETLARRSIESMFQMFMVESVAVPRLLTPSSWPGRVRIAPAGAGLMRENIELLLSNRPMLMVTGHCGNWELLGFTLALLGFDTVALARPLDNPWLDAWIRAVREARGLRILTKFGATTEVQRVVESGGRVGFIADQNAGSDGLFVPFFGKLASSYKSIGLLAMRYELPVVTGIARRTGDSFRYEVDCVDVMRPADWADAPDPLYYITARFNRAIEQGVRSKPEQYLWVHRRWKSRPQHEIEGKPMPERLRTKLRQLPWMTDAELDRIERPFVPAPEGP